MCDFSLQSVRSRPAKVGDKLVTRDFGTGTTRGFAAADDLGLAVCVMTGTELAFAGEVACLPTGPLGWMTRTINHQTAIFRQVNKDKSAAHHDALESRLAHRCASRSRDVDGLRGDLEEKPRAMRYGHAVALCYQLRRGVVSDSRLRRGYAQHTKRCMATG
jgi:hypothetical protein